MRGRDQLAYQLHALARHLRTRGFLVEEAPTAEAAEQALDGGLRPALVLLDLNLPGDTGWDLLRGGWIARAGSPPVVIASATTLSPRRLAEFGVAGYLPKPFPLETLLATIERLIEKDEKDNGIIEMKAPAEES